jgi:hypothetical protein
MTVFERKWGFMKSTLAGGGFPTDAQEFGEALTKLSKMDKLKAEFLLILLPPFYNTLVENLRISSRHTREYC